MDITRSRTQPDVFSRRLFAPLAGRYDRLAEILSMGQNRRWRTAMVEHITGANSQLVLDVACGPARVSRALAEATNAYVVGLDLSDSMLSQGKANVAAAGLQDRIGLALGRGEELPFADATFDALTFTYLLRYVTDPAATLAELARVVKPGGSIASLEFAVPTAPWWRIAWWCYTRIVLPIAGFITGGRAWFRVGRFLGPSISTHYREYPVDWTITAWNAAGVGEVGTRRMSLGGGLIMWGRRE
ncbi:MAG: demethylmenaquinone methyltransferase / 2-methoxy-6-polyprenyl,4-benzoquinol methylase [Ilumatobacteraceae bacterium]|jgi:demethylmenaquinone methyltransferase/2-methoxy-6-polyprenyl-1,4-benzoquinol methylase